MELYFILLFGCLGLVIGSFLNVCIYRIPKKESIVFGNSHCTVCKNPIKPYDLIPVISYILLLGKCRHCKSSISYKYPLIELLCAGLFICVYSVFGLSLNSVLYCALSSLLIVVVFIDFETQEIPNGVIISILILGIISTLMLKEIPFWHRIIGFFSASIILLIIYIVSNGGIGEGDIKLMAVAGLVIGYKAILLSLFIGCVLGGIVGSFLLITKIAKRDTAIAFGPYLSIGIFISALFSNNLLNWYLSYFIR